MPRFKVTIVRTTELVVDAPDLETLEKASRRPARALLDTFVRNPAERTISVVAPEDAPSMRLRATSDPEHGFILVREALVVSSRDELAAAVGLIPGDVANLHEVPWLYIPAAEETLSSAVFVKSTHLPGGWAAQTVTEHGQKRGL